MAQPKHGVVAIRVS